MHNHDVKMLVCIIICSCIIFRYQHEDILAPYHKNHGSKNTIRQVRSIQSNKYGNTTYETWKAHVSSSILPLTNTRYLNNMILFEY